MPEIIPAIMPDSLVDFEEKAKAVAGLVPLAQIDVMDGVFVPSVSWPYREGQWEEFQKFAAEAVLPYMEVLRYEVDLMVSEPEHVIEDWIRAGAERLIIHVESTKRLDDILSDALEWEGKLGRPLSAGLALDIETPNDAINQYAGRIEFVQCMGIAKIGYQGQPFDERVILKIKEMQTKHPELIIAVDGGVSQETIARLIEAGAARLVAGSAIFNADDKAEAIEKLQQLAIA